MKTKNIILYGCDNSGKTTAANDIVEILKEDNLKCEMLHSLGPVSTREMLNFMLDHIKDDDSLDVRVFDRFPCIEEFVYGPIIRGNNGLELYRDTCLYALSHIDLFIHCKPSLDVVENWGEREQMDGVKSNAEKIYAAYDHIPEMFNIQDRVITYDWTKRTEEGKSLKDILKAGGVLK